MDVNTLGIATGFLCATLLGADAFAQATTRESVAWNGAEGIALCSDALISADGRYVVFDSDATNIVPVDTNGFRDVFVRDRLTNTTTLVSVDSSGVQGNGLSSESGASISANGRYIAFYSSATNLVPVDTNGFRDVFVRDLQLGTTTLVSVSSGGVQGDALSSEPTISADGRYVAFYSSATNLVPGDVNGFRDVIVRDLQLGTTTLVSVSSGGAQGNGLSSGPMISADGRYVAFYSSATNLVPVDGNGFRDVFVRDLQLGTTTLASVSSAGVQGNELSSSPTISGNGRYVSFYSDATTLVAADTNVARDIFVRDLQALTTTRVSVSSGGVQGDASSSPGPIMGSGALAPISADGRFVAFESSATNLVSNDLNMHHDSFVHDLVTGTTIRISVDSGGVEGNGSSGAPSISSTGRFVAFGSLAMNLVAGDTNLVEDVFLRDLGAPAPTGFCFGDGLDPGHTTPCPCGNNGTAGNGCANSVNAGGGKLTASGTGNPDTIVLMGSGMPAAVSCIYLQGDALSDVVFGDGVRCAGGGLIRLRTKVNVGGASHFPDVGDPSVSSRGMVTPGTGVRRYYQAYYRNSAAAFCPPQTFNVTNGSIIDW